MSNNIVINQYLGAMIRVANTWQWMEEEKLIPNPDPNSEPNTEANSEPKTEASLEPKTEASSEPKTEASSEPKDLEDNKSTDHNDDGVKPESCCFSKPSEIRYKVYVLNTLQGTEGEKLIPNPDPSSDPNPKPSPNPESKPDPNSSQNSDINDLKDNKNIDLPEAHGETEPSCCSSPTEFRYRVWDFFTRWKYIILPCC